MADKRELVLQEGLKEKQKIVKKDGDEVVGVVEGILKKLFLGIDVEVLTKRIDDLKLKQDSGSLTDADKKALPKLLKIFEGKKTEIEGGVEGLFRDVVDNPASLSDLQIKSRAMKLIDEIGDSSVVSAAKRDKLGEIAKSGLILAKKVKNGAGGTRKQIEDDKKITAEWAYEQKNTSEFETSLTRETKLGQLKAVVLGVTDHFEGLDVDDLKSQLNAERGNRNKSAEKTTELLPLDEIKKKELKNGVGLRTKQKERKLIDDLADDNFKDDEFYKLIQDKLTRNRELTPREKSILHEYNNQLIDLQLSLRDNFWNKSLEGVPGLKLRTFGRTKFEVSGVEVDVSIGNLKKRLKDAFKIIDFDVVDPADIDTQKSFLLATGITQVQADKIWDNAQEWSSNYSKFSRGVDQLRRESFRAEYGREHRYTEEAKDIRDMSGENEQMKWHQLIEKRINDEPIYTEEGKRRKRQLEEVKLNFEEVGKDSEGNPIWKIKDNSFLVYSAEMQQNISELPQELQQQLEEERQRAREKMNSMQTPEEAIEWLRDEVEKQIYQIYDTGDSSRAPGNQMASMRLYMYMGMMPGEADFKTKWMARLSIYDVKMFMSGVENYEEWAKVNSFLPIEFRSYLHKDDMEIGEFIHNGNPKKIKLNFADVYTFYEEQDGSSGDPRDIWIARLLGAKNMEEVDLAKRQIMASYLGKQMGISFKFEKENGKEVFRQVGNDTLTHRGSEVSLLKLVGLDENGQRIKEKLRVAGDIDLKSIYGWYMDMPVDMGHLDLRWIGLERGGTRGDWWPQQMNGLRKLHGLSQVDYHKRKNMSMETAVNEMDSGWRSALSWKLFETHKGSDQTVYFQDVETKLSEQGITDKKKKEAFFGVIKQAVYLPEFFENGGLGELRSIAEVRGLAGNELSKVLAEYTKFDSSNTFNWKSIIEMMGAEIPPGTNVVGRAGVEVFLKNFSLHRLITYDGIPHNLVADFIKYTGYSEAYWKASVKAGDHIWDMKIQKELVEAVKAYHGKKGGGWKSKQLLQRQVRKGAMANIEGQETYINSKGEEAAELWKPSSNSEINDARSRGWRIDKDGYVVDENNRYQYRPGKIGYWDGFGSPFKNWSKGSAAGRHGHPTTNWKTAKEITKGYLKSRMLTPEQYWVENKRFKYAMYFDVDVPWQENPDMKLVFKALLKKPWKIALLPYTILRGLAVDLGLQTEDVVEFFSPLGKEISKQLSK
ncbi:hypothetical protein KBD75_01590 [Candidatus Woesebacteria bacterium]|nr:hypothetical protein [Candidatus Woesebacteria bacterium]